MAYTQVPNGRMLDVPEAARAVICDPDSGVVRNLRRGATDLFWSANGREIAAVDYLTGTDGSDPVVILDAATGEASFNTRIAVNPMDPILSPDGRLLAVHFHLSRPLTGHTILDRRTGENVCASYTPLPYAPGILGQWSPDGRWLLWSWRITVPGNDGSWIREYVGLTSATGAIRRRLGQGSYAAFSPEGRHVLWLRRLSCRSTPADLVWCDLAGRGTRCILKGVMAYAIAP